MEKSHSIPFTIGTSVWLIVFSLSVWQMLLFTGADFVIQVDENWKHLTNCEWLVSLENSPLSINT